MNVFSEKVSVFRTCYETTPFSTVLLKDWLQTKLYEKVICALRHLDRAPELQIQDKKALPAITPLGVFSQRSASGLLEYSGFVCIDVDGKDNPHVRDWDVLKEQLGRQFPSLYYAGLSCSGRGIFLIFRVRTPDRYSEHLNSLFHALQECGVKADLQCRDVARLRFASYDAHPYENYDALPYDQYWEKLQPASKRSDSLLYWTKNRDHYVELLVSEIERRGIDITKGYSAWYAIGCSLANHLGETGRSYFHRVSRFNEAYAPEDCDRQYDACLQYSSQYAIGTFLYYCKQYEVILKNLINYHGK